MRISDWSSDVCSSDLPWLADIGVSGVGMTPAVVALSLYCLLPIVRNTSAGLAGVAPSVVEAARGMGMTPRPIFLRIEVPRALPVFLRSEERRVGYEGVRKCRYRWWPVS